MLFSYSFHHLIWDAFLSPLSLRFLRLRLVLVTGSATGRLRVIDPLEGERWIELEELMSWSVVLLPSADVPLPLQEI